MGRNLPRPVRARRGDAGGRAGAAPVPGAADARHLRRPLHLLPPDRPAHVLQLGGRVRRRRRGQGRPARRGRLGHLLHRAVLLDRGGRRGPPSSSDRYQFALSTVFTPEGAKNLRAIATAYMDGEDYGKLSMLQVPKGLFYPGPEQADAAIDQDPFISQQISLWNRLGLDVIRGHTTPLVIDGEVIYLEPLLSSRPRTPSRSSSASSPSSAGTRRWGRPSSRRSRPRSRAGSRRAHRCSWRLDAPGAARATPVAKSAVGEG